MALSWGFNSNAHFSRVFREHTGCSPSDWRASALRHLAWTLPVLALLAGCNGGESAKPEPHAVATYAPATWKDLPAVSDEDLLAGFYAWRNGCEKLKRDPVWAATCEAAGSATASAAQVRTFLEQNLQVYGLRSGPA